MPRGQPVMAVVINRGQRGRGYENKSSVTRGAVLEENV